MCKGSPLNSKERLGNKAITGSDVPRMIIGDDSMDDSNKHYKQLYTKLV